MKISFIMPMLDNFLVDREKPNWPGGRAVTRSSLQRRSKIQISRRPFKRNCVALWREARNLRVVELVFNIEGGLFPKCKTKLERLSLIFEQIFCPRLGEDQKKGKRSACWLGSIFVTESSSSPESKLSHSHCQRQWGWILFLLLVQKSLSKVLKT